MQHRDIYIRLTDPNGNHKPIARIANSAIVWGTILTLIVLPQVLVGL